MPVVDLTEALRTTASLVFLAALGAGIAAAARLRGVPGGRRLAVMLLGLSVALFVQDGLGKAAADGRDTLWLHVPLGVAVVGLAAQASMGARRLGPVTA